LPSQTAPSRWLQLLDDCLNGRQQQALLCEQGDELSLHCHAHHVLLRVQLTHPGLQGYPLQAWVRLGQASLAHFNGALALCPASGHLWLVQNLPRECSQDYLLSALEALLNQRDTWRRIVARQARPGRKYQAYPLRKPLH